jgi:hypothetical protein
MPFWGCTLRKKTKSITVSRNRHKLCCCLSSESVERLFTLLAAFAAAPICSHHRGPQLVVVSVKAEPIEETEESGIIFACREQRLNNRAATLR